MKKEDLDADPQSMDNRRLGAIARNPNHPMHTHAKAELVRRKVKKAEMGEQKVDEISLDDLKAKISSSGMKSTKKAMGADKLKKDLAAMKAKLATEATDDEYHKTLANTKNSDEGIAALKKKHGMSHAKATATIKRLMGEAKDPEEYDNEGSMMKSQLRQICSANEKLMSMVKDDDNLPEWVQSKVTKATDYIRSVRDYLESEKMDESVDWVCGKCNCDPCTCGEEIEEKTLTPAEKRKREKIAKAIERDNPDMPMDKKMAIATATAKRVAEVSSDKLGDYMRASSKDVAKSRGDARRQDKRIAGQSMADKKIRKKMGYSSTAKVPAGKNEQTDLSRIRTILDRNKK